MNDDGLAREVREGLRSLESSVSPPTIDGARSVAVRRRRRRRLAVGAVSAVVVAGAGLWMAQNSDGPDTSTAVDSPVDVTDPPLDDDSPVSTPPPTTDAPALELTLPDCRALTDPAVVIDGPLSTDAEVAAAQQARAGFGFASDEATVAALLSAPPPELPEELEALGQDMAMGVGVVLTAAEVQDMFDRQLGPIREASGEAIIAFAEANPRTYVGRWIDQAAGGVFRVAVTGDLEAQWAELESTLPDGHRVEMELAPRSLAELEVIRGRLVIEMSALGLNTTIDVIERVGHVAIRFMSSAGLDIAALEAAVGDDPVCVSGVGEVGRAVPLPSAVDPTSPGFRTHARFPASDEMGTLTVALTNAEIAAMWPDRGELGPAPMITEGAQIALRFTVPDDACPEIFGGLVEVGDRYEIQMIAAGYGGCVSPLIPRTYIATVDRVDNLPLDAGPVTIALAADDSFHAANELTVDLPEAVAVEPPPIEPPASIRGAVTGLLSLPAPRTAQAGQLLDGTPVVVVAHDASTVSVIDLRVPAGDTRFGDDGDLQTRALTSWWGGAGRFLGSGVWDRYGRSLDNGPHRDLIRYSASVDGEFVIVGAELMSFREPGDPIVAEEAFGPSADAMLPELSSVEEAVRAAAGTIVFVDAAVVVSSETGARVCEVDGERIADLTTCPDGAPVVDDLEQASPDGRVWTTWFHGPLLMRRTETGFAEVINQGGRSGSAG